MNGDFNFVTPFGPTILVHKCSKDILNKINDYVSYIERDEKVYSTTSSFSKYKNVPDLLNRGIENIFFYYDYCKESGIADYLENLSETYCDVLDLPDSYKLSIIDKGVEDDFSFCNNIKYADCWVNKYWKGDYTPVHKHGSDLAGVIFLKIPKEIEEESMSKQSNLGGLLQFIHTFDILGNSSSWIPEHQVGNLFLFPSWLQHLVYPQTSNEERRTFSFNLISKEESQKRHSQFK